MAREKNGKIKLIPRSGLVKFLVARILSILYSGAIPRIEEILSLEVTLLELFNIAVVSMPFCTTEAVTPDNSNILFFIEIESTVTNDAYLKHQL